jgi:CAI-1 autoinducer synthase
MRFTVNSDLTLAELDRVIEVCADIREEVGLAQWPSTRRRR